MLPLQAHRAFQSPKERQQQEQRPKLHQEHMQQQPLVLVLKKLLLLDTFCRVI
jgi:hypothetical protein